MNIQVFYVGMDDQYVRLILLEKEQQRRRHSPVRQTEPDTAFMYEPCKPVYTYNRDSDMVSIRKPSRQEFESYCSTYDVPMLRVTRAGGLIWHGPGQLIIAPVIDLARIEMDHSIYREHLENLSLHILATYGVRGLRNAYTHTALGIWVTDPHTQIREKIAFLGFYMRSGIVLHGCAINVSCDLEPFKYIDPCNLPGVSVSSIEKLTGKAPPLREVAEVAKEYLTSVF